MGYTMSNGLETIVWKTIKVPENFEKTFDRKIKSHGKYINFPDFVRQAVNEKIERDLN